MTDADTETGAERLRASTAAAQPERRRIKITNTSPGPRVIHTEKGGTTIPVNGSATVTLTQNDARILRPYVDLGHLTFSEPDPEEDGPVSRDMPPRGVPSTARPLGEGVGDIVEPSTYDALTHVEHRGFGHWFGMAGTDSITESMNRQDAAAFAAEHGVPIGKMPDPTNPEAATADEDESKGPTPPPDETK